MGIGRPRAEPIKMPKVYADAFGLITSDANEPGYLNITVRQRIDAAGLANFGRRFARVTIEAHPTEAFQVGAAYIGLKAAAGDAYDFASTPVPLLWDGGATGTTITAGTTKVSAPAAITIPAAAAGVIVSVFVVNNAAADSTRGKTTQANCFPYYKVGGNDAATVNATGYTDYSATRDLVGVMRIEVAYGGGFFVFFFKNWKPKWELAAGIMRPTNKLVGMQI